ncbi:MAG: hypothetical protein Fur005_31740 [Roseiflexaceae bacterium]
METLFLIVGLVLAIIWARPTPPAPQPNYIIVQATPEPSEAATGGSGCLIWLIGGVLLLMFSGAIPT